MSGYGELTMSKLKRSEVYQEDVNDMICNMIETVENTVEISDEESDELWDALAPVMEKFFYYPDFRSYN